MSRRDEGGHGDAPGQDSFLDVVCNIVGVLIILVMVVGSQAQKSIMAKYTEKAAAEAASAAPSEAVPDVKEAVADVAALEREIAETQQKIERESMEAAMRKRERDRAMLMVTAANAQIEIARQKLTSQQRDDFDLKNKTRVALQELTLVDEAIDAAQTKGEQPVEVLKHYPTPIAKTVFGKELHFRLQGGRLAYVPFDEFVERLKQDASRHVWKLKQADSVTEMLGPLEGFRMRYTLRREEVSVPVSGGVAKQEKAVLENFVLIPLQDDLGEPVAEALRENSDLRFRLSQANSKQYTVTLWVYPDSFEHFRPVREALMKVGYTCAGRPMPEGHPIGGSPDGSRSAAQ